MTSLPKWIFGQNAPFRADFGFGFVFGLVCSGHRCHIQHKNQQEKAARYGSTKMLPIYHRSFNFGPKTTTSILKWQNWPNIWSLKCLSLSFISRHIASNFWSRIEAGRFFAKECLIEMLSHLIDFIFRMWSTSSTIMGLPTQWRHDSFNFRDWWSLPPWIEPEPKWSTFCHKEPQIRWINMGKYEYMYAYQLYMKEGGF